MRAKHLLRRIAALSAMLVIATFSCVYASLPVPVFTGVALSTTSIQWNWTDESGPAIDGYHLYSTTAPTFIIVNATYYIEAGLRPNQEMDRYITTYKGATESDDSNDVDLYSYAVPGEILFVDTITASSAYMMFTWGEATAYVLECSTNAGITYTTTRDIFVPWQTFPVLANENYMIRLGARNGDGLQGFGFR